MVKAANAFFILQKQKTPIKDVYCGYLEDIRESINDVNTCCAIVFYTA